MNEGPKRDLTRLLKDGATDELLPLVYDELKAIAEGRMRQERAGHTLQPTALVNEAWLRLAGNSPLPFANREQFFAVAAECMRRILIDWARKRGSEKRGGGKKPVPLDIVDVIDLVDLAERGDPEQILSLDEALTKLEGEDARAAKVVRLRFFAGLSVAEVVAATGMSERTVLRDWEFARARLFQILTPEAGSA